MMPLELISVILSLTSTFYTGITEAYFEALVLFFGEAELPELPDLEPC